MSASRRSERLRVKRSRLAATDNDVDSAQQLEATRESVAKHEKQKKKEERRRLNVQRQQLARMTEAEPEKQERLRLNAQRQQLARMMEAEHENQERLRLNAQRQQLARTEPGKKSSARFSLTEFDDGVAFLPQRLSIADMVEVCSACSAKMWKKETHSGTAGVLKFSTCCNQGKVVLPPISDAPVVLQNLMLASTPEAKRFRDNIRAYNSSLAFTSLGANTPAVPGHGPPVFQIQGTVYHRTGHLMPEEGDKPQFSQLYIYDVTNELDNRKRWNDTLHGGTLRSLQNMMHSVNPFVQHYQHAADVLQQHGITFYIIHYLTIQS